MGRLRACLYWSLPSLLFVSLHFSGLQSGYMRDDFAWLSLHHQVHDVSSFFAALFQPLAQGTIRPFSERLFFMAGWELFGMEAFPLRVVVFLTQVMNLVMLTAVTKRLTGSALAGFLAPVLWVCNANLYAPFAWTSAFNQVLCALVLLTAFYFFLKYCDSGGRRYYIVQWLVFLFGFGVLELTVVYPALAGLYALCCCRQRWKSTLPMFAASAIYTVVHQSLAPAPTSDTYRLFFDVKLFQTLAHYIAWAVGGDLYADSINLPVRPFYLAEAIVLLSLASFIGWMLARRQWLAGFLAGWFFIVLAPVLPLKNHVSDYYLTIPIIGPAILGAWGISMAVARGRAAAWLAATLALVYAIPSAWAGTSMTRAFSAVSRRGQTFVSSLAYAQRQHPGKSLLIRDVNYELYWSAWHDNPFPLLGVGRAYLGSEVMRQVDTKMAPGLKRHILPPSLVQAGLKQGQLVIYQVSADGRLQNRTLFESAWFNSASTLSLPSFLDAGSPFSEVHFKTGWWQPEQAYRWTARRAELQLRGPLKRGGELIIDGICPPEAAGPSPLMLTVSVNAVPYPSVPIGDQPRFRLRFPLHESTVGRTAINIAVEVNRTRRFSNDSRELGVAFGTFEVIP